MSLSNLFARAGILLILATFAATVIAQEPASQKRLPVIFMAGDSTMAKKQPDKRPETGWGEMLDRFFQDGKVTIDNRAMNGRSSRTFISEGRWQGIVDALQPGDFVFIQFGHNDQAKEKVERYTPPADYRQNLIRFISDARAGSATPVLFTPVMRRAFDNDGKLKEQHGQYPDIVRSVAAEYRVPLIDMYRSSANVLRDYGPEPSRKLFLHLKADESPNYPKGLEDNTHFNPLGAEVMASLAADAIGKQKLKLAKYLNGKAKEMAREFANRSRKASN